MVDVDDSFRDAFLLFDKRGDGKVELSVLGTVLRACGLNPTEADVKRIIKEVSGGSPDTRITFEEYWPIYEMQKKRDTKAGVEEFLECFKIFDTDQTGLISKADLFHVLCGLGEKLTEDDVNSLSAGMEDKNGLLNYEEFVRTVITS